MPTLECSDHLSILRPPGKKLPRWKPRTTRCVNMGLSPLHATSVPLVLNPDTGAITPQFHVVFDNWFTTVASSFDQLPYFNSTEWRDMFGDYTFFYPYDDDDLQHLTDESSAPTPQQVSRDERVRAAVEAMLPSAPLPISPPPTYASPAHHLLWQLTRRRRLRGSATPVTSRISHVSRIILALLQLP